MQKRRSQILFDNIDQTKILSKILVKRWCRSMSEQWCSGCHQLQKYITIILAVIAIKRCFFCSFIPLMHYDFFNVAIFYEKLQFSIWFYLQTWSSTDWWCPRTWGSLSFVTLYQPKKWWYRWFVSFVTFFLYQPQRWWSWWFVRHTMMLLRKTLW